MVMDELCRRLAVDLDGAFPELVDALASDVYSGLRRLAGADDAEDLTQETFIRAYRALGEASGSISVSEAMAILDSVSGSNTIWSAVYDMTTDDIEVVMDKRYDQIHTFRLEMQETAPR